MLDTIIIGASLSGLSAGRALREAGITNFLILDQKEAVGTPLKCGEAVDCTVLDELYPEVSDNPPSWCLQKISRHVVRYENVEREFFFDYYELDRPEFEKWLVKPIEENLRLSTRVQGIGYRRDGIEVVAGENLLLARSVILACGANYRLHETLGLLREEPELGYAFGGIFSPKQEHPGTFLWELSSEAEGYHWIFPKRQGEVNAGTAGVKAKAIRPAFQKFSYNFVENQKLTLGGKYPTSGPLKKTFTDRVLVTGDAAGFVYAGTGEGIGYALLSGKFAAETLQRAIRVDDFSAVSLKVYESLWQRKFGKKLKAGVHFKRHLQFLFRSGKMATVLRKIPQPLLERFILDGRIPPRLVFKWAWEKILLGLKPGNRDHRTAGQSVSPLRPMASESR